MRKLMILGSVVSTLASVAMAEQIFEMQELFSPELVETEFSEEIASQNSGAEKAQFNPDYSVKKSEVSPVDLAKVGGPIGSPTSEVTGSLSGKIVYLMAGHGWTYESGPNAFGTQRFLFNDIIEDFGNLDQATIVADYLLNTGATVVPLRPFGIQENEVVLDNDDPQVTFGGSWSTSSSTQFYGTAGDVPYVFASSVTGSPTHTAVYNASTLLPTSDYYPVYVWTRSGSDRINQQYIVEHSGGTTTRRINHQMVGSGWMYLGTFHFEQNGDASVTITNLEEVSDPGSVVIADAVRWGNGMGDTELEGVASGFPRHEENGEFWLVESRGEGSGLSAAGSVSSPPRLATHMNRSGTGADTDRVYLSFHSNGGGGRGADGLFNNTPPASFSDPATANSFTTPNGADFAQELGTVVNTDMTTLSNAAGNYLPTAWGQTGAGTNVFGSSGAGFSAYGEINNSTINDEMAATIIETAFHDSAADSQIMRDPRGREAIGRAVVHGVINYFNEFGGSSNTYPPEQPDEPFIESDGSGNLTLSWTSPVAGGPFGAGGDAPSSFLIEISENGKGFQTIQTVGFATTSVNVTSSVPINGTRYFRVTALNSGGVSTPSIVVGARRSTSAARALVVNGYDRYDSSLNRLRTEPSGLGSATAGGGTFDRVIPRFNNRFDYVVDMGDALNLAGVSFDSCQNENIISGDVLLGDYDAVYWTLGAESTVDSSFDGTEQTLVTTYLQSNGSLFVSGAEAAWDLGRTAASAGNKAFLQNILNVQQFSSGNPEDDAGTYSAQGVGSTIFDGLATFSFSDGSDIHGDFDVAFPDILNPLSPAITAMTYSGGASAAIQFDDRLNNNGRAVFVGFPIEVVLSDSAIESIIDSSATFFDLDTPPSNVSYWSIF